MRFCPFCGGENDEAATQCRGCARRLPPPARRRTSVQEEKNAVPGPRSFTPHPRHGYGPPGQSGEMPALRSQGPLAVPHRVVAELSQSAVMRAPTDVNPDTPIPEAVDEGDTQPQLSTSDERPPSIKITKELSERWARELALPEVTPVPEAPSHGLMASARYTVSFGRALWQRRAVEVLLVDQIAQETSALDELLGKLGALAREAKLTHKTFAEENAAIDAAEARRDTGAKARDALETRLGEERAKAEEVAKGLEERQRERERVYESAVKKLADTEAKRQMARDRKKELERQRKQLEKGALDADSLADKAPDGAVAKEQRQIAYDLRRQAKECEGVWGQAKVELSDLDKQCTEAQVAHDTAKGELEAARRAVEDAREGHRHRMAELEAEGNRRATELGSASSEIARRLVTLGTLVNLHRVTLPPLLPIYEEIDQRRSGIALRKEAKDTLAAERDAFDRAAVIRGAAVLVACVVGVFTLLGIVWMIVT